MTTKLQISIVLPAHNEAENLPILVSDITNCLNNLGWEYEIIIVNDGSTDNTKNIVLELKNKNNHIKEVDHQNNRGYGGAVRSGFSAATKEWVFFTDSDRQFDIREISKLAEYADTFDLVIGYRKNRQDHFTRKLNAGIFKLAVNILFGLFVKDIDCAFKLIKKEVIEKVNLESNGALINTELLVRAKRLGYKIKQIPVSHYPRLKGEQSGASIKVVLRAVKEIILFRLTDRTVSELRQKE